VRTGSEIKDVPDRDLCPASPSNDSAGVAG
jgi:hypothetical protein